MIARIEAFVARALPPEWVKTLQRAKQHLPLRLTLSPPVLQAWVNDGESRCFVGIHNFYSVLLPEAHTDAVAELVFRGEDGSVVLEHSQAVPHLGGASVDVAALFTKHGVRARVGTVAVQLTPRWPRRRVYRSLGQVTSHFFVHHQGESGSVGQIHPLATDDPRNQAAGPFRSSQVISTAGLQALEVVQYNATHAAHRLTHQLLDADTGALVASSSMSLQPLGAGVSRFDIAALVAPPARLLFTIDDLPAANAKPILRRVYAGGLFSVSHA